MKYLVSVTWDTQDCPSPSLIYASEAEADAVAATMNSIGFVVATVVPVPSFGG